MEDLIMKNFFYNKKYFFITCISGFLVCVTLTFMLQGCGLETAKDDGPLNLSDFLNNETDDENMQEETQEEVQDTEEDAVIEVIDPTEHSAEFEEAYSTAEVVGIAFTMPGESEPAIFDSWQEAYTSVLNSLENFNNGALVEVDEGEIPELFYNITEFGQPSYYVATYSDGYVYVYGNDYGRMLYVEYGNAVHAITNEGLDSFVVAIRDGNWVQVGHGVLRPVDMWSEDGFDENGNPIINGWEWNGQALDTEEEYYEMMNKFIPSAYAMEVDSLATLDQVLEFIEEYED